MTNACAWCGHSDDSLTTITVDAPDRLAASTREQTLAVHPEHEAPLRAYLEHARTHGRRFLVLVVLLAGVGPLVGIGLLAVSERLGLTVVGSSVAALGGVLMVYPFATPETVHLLGVKRARVTVRVVAVLVVALGIWIVATAA